MGTRLLILLTRTRTTLVMTRGAAFLRRISLLRVVALFSPCCAPLVERLVSQTPLNLISLKQARKFPSACPLKDQWLRNARRAYVNALSLSGLVQHFVSLQVPFRPDSAHLEPSSAEPHLSFGLLNAMCRPHQEREANYRNNTNLYTPFDSNVTKPMEMRTTFPSQHQPPSSNLETIPFFRPTTQGEQTLSMRRPAYDQT